MAVGIDKIGVYLPKRYVDMTELAKVRGEDPDKFTIGIGQEQMAINTKDEDIVAMGANAAKDIVKGAETEIDQIIFATESGFDYSKASATYIHELLGIHEFAKSFEVKQACYSGTAGLQMATDYVRLRPNRKALVIVSDVARYGLESSEEATQGAGALALLISSNPRILALDIESVSYTKNAFDFFRPDKHEVPTVDGRGSMRLYQRTFGNVMKEFKERSWNVYQTIESVIFHLPFSRMGEKALQYYRRRVRRNEDALQDLELLDRWENHYEASTLYGKNTGNIYTGSMYLSLLSLLDQGNLHGGERVALFSYGSGTVAELVTGTLQKGYQKMLELTNARAQFEKRIKVSVEEYEQIYTDQITSVTDYQSLEKQSPEAGFYLSQIRSQQHHYAYLETD